MEYLLSYYSSYIIYIIAIQSLDMDNNINTIILSTSLVHKVFEYIDDDYKLLIHREGSSDEERSKRLSIELIMRSGLEEYFEDVLLCYRWRDELCNEAARRGHVNTLKWAREHDCGWDSDTCKAAAEQGHLDCLIWAREHGCDWNLYTCRAAALGGHLDCLIWAREHGCDWDSDTCSAAAEGGQLDCLIWAREHGCEWDRDTCHAAAREGHLDCLIWAREHGCDWNWQTCEAAARLNLQVKNMNLSNRGSLLATLHPGGPGPRIRRPRGPPV